MTVDRRAAIATIAATEQLGALAVQYHARSRSLQAVGRLVETRLRDIELCLLAVADDADLTDRDQWLSTAERWLTFYVSELRRLQDESDDPSTTGPWPVH